MSSAPAFHPLRPEPPQFSLHRTESMIPQFGRSPRQWPAGAGLTCPARRQYNGRVMADALVHVRPALADDFDAVAALLAELGRPALTGETRMPTQSVYERHLARPDTASLVAEWDSVAVGFLSLEFRERLNRMQSQAWIPDLIVTDSARGRGVGRALLERAFLRARERGCWGVTLESGYARQVAHQLYRAAGMTDGGLYFSLELDS